MIACISVLWICRTWERSPEHYNQESIADKLRRQLRKLPLNIELFLGDRTLESLSPEAVQTLAQTLPLATQKDRLMIYHGVLQEALDTGLVTTRSSLKLLNQLRLSLDIDDIQHDQFLGELIDAQARPGDFFIYGKGNFSSTDVPRTLIRQRSNSAHTTHTSPYEPTQIRRKS
ncbi:MAG: hypothetical protein HC771_00765 [Synechococcales cyanobacterium CRU_2_2]|nr:hypothetical protein [Synechococcales cyanobacterium CRU_2_2]